MKTRMVLLLVIGVVIVCAGNAMTQTPLNGDFELGNGQVVNAWSWWSREGQGTATRTDEDASEGRHSVRIEHNGQRDWAFASSTRQTAKPGDGFRVSAWVKVETGHVVLAVVALKDGETVWWDIGSTRRTDADGWQRMEAAVEVPDNCDAVYVRFVGEGLTLVWVDGVRLERYVIDHKITAPKPKVDGYAKKRIRENMDRAVIARRLEDGTVYIGWRLLADDPEDIAFDVYRQVDGRDEEKVNGQPVTQTTDYVDTTAHRGVPVSYRVKARTGQEDTSPPVPVTSDACRIIDLGDSTRFRKIGIADLDGDGRYDYVIKQPSGNVDPYINYWKKSPDTFTLEAYHADGRLLWTYDLGWAIERGIWYSPFVVYDFDGDGRAEVAVKTGEGDPRDEDGRVQTGPEFLTILDGQTGTEIAQVPWPSRDLFAHTSRPYNYASRNQLGVAYLDGRTPSLIVERGTYNVIVVVAYELHGGRLRELWQWDNRELPRRYSGQGAHSMHAADVDGDGRDEVIIGSAVIDDNGDSLWSTGLGHPDHCYVGDIDPARPGLEIYYGIETRRKFGNGMCLVDAATGEILWGYEKPTRHVHSVGLCSDIDSRYPGAEAYSVDTDSEKKPAFAYLWSSTGEQIDDTLRWRFGPMAVYWDADPQREILWRGRISDYRGTEHEPRIEGRVVLVADLMGDWREEIVTSVAGELRIYTTTIPAVDRRPGLMTDPIYRIDVANAAMGYTQVPMLSYDLATQVSGRGASVD